jgi:threonine synthase
VEGAETYASGLRVPGAVGDFLILRALRESGGGAVAVSDTAMAEWVSKLGADTGIFAAPEGGATAAAVEALMGMGLIEGDDEVVLFNTEADSSMSEWSPSTGSATVIAPGMVRACSAP